MIRRQTQIRSRTLYFLFSFFLFLSDRAQALPDLKTSAALGSLTDCAPLLSRRTHPSAEETLEYERELLIQGNGPFQQKLVAKQGASPSGEPVWFVGVASSMKHMDERTAAALPLLKALKGSSETYAIPERKRNQKIKILTAGAVTGSAARLNLAKQANDYDFETLLIVNEQEGSLDSLSQARSHEIEAVARYLKDHIEKVLVENPNFRFIELKAGTYRSEYDPDTGELKGIKWSLQALRRGSVDVIDGGKKRHILLTEALAEDARIKADWAVPNPNLNAPIKDAYVEATALYRLGIKIGNNQARLRGSDQTTGVTEALPLRATSLVMVTNNDKDGVDEQDLALILETSRATTSVAKERVHQAILRSIKKYLAKDHFKVIKRVGALLQFWDYDSETEKFGQDFSIFLKHVAIKKYPDLVDKLSDNAMLFEQTRYQLRGILRDDRLLELSQIKAQAELLECLEEHHIALPDGSETLWLNRVKDRFQSDGLTEADLPSVIEYIDRKIKDRMELLLSESRLARLYEEFVLKRMAAMEGNLSETASFLASAPNTEFVKLYRKKLVKWKRAYPDLEFTDPDDLHMTWHFNGKLTDVAERNLRGALMHFGADMTFSGGGLKVAGRNDNILAFVYRATAEQSQSVSLVKAIASEQGARPELRFFSFMPHLTFAKFDPNNLAAKAQITRFLTENIPQFESVTLQALELWENDPKNTTSNDGRRYRLVPASR